MTRLRPFFIGVGKGTLLKSSPILRILVNKGGVVRIFTIYTNYSVLLQFYFRFHNDILFLNLKVFDILNILYGIGVRG